MVKGGHYENDVFFPPFKTFIDSIIREVFNEAQKDSKIKTWSYTMSKEQIDDPTGEIARLKEKVSLQNL